MCIVRNSGIPYTYNRRLIQYTRIFCLLGGILKMTVRGAESRTRPPLKKSNYALIVYKDYCKIRITGPRLILIGNYYIRFYGYDTGTNGFSIYGNV